MIFRAAASWVCLGRALIGFLMAASQVHAQTPAPAAPRNVVLWISIDGFRGDYIGKKSLPFFNGLMKDGGFTGHLQPIFPSITFPSHSVEMTGVPPDQNGITGNSMLDERTNKVVHFPPDASLLQAEPLWVTAERQGVRTAVLDWPLSQNEPGPVRASYFLDRYDDKLTDEERLSRILENWKADQAPQPLRLIIGYIPSLDHAGHQYGPEAPQIATTLQRIDQEMGSFLHEVLQLWDQKMTKNDHLYLLITTDHGMQKVQNIVDVHRLASPLVLQGAEIVTNGPVASFYFPEVAAGELAGRVGAVKAQISTQPFLECYARDELPAAWHYQHPTRVGDLVVVLKPGYTFGKTVNQALLKVADASDVQGMHGYPLETAPEMQGTMLLWRYPDPIGARDLGNVSVLQIEPTVAQILGIAPSVAAKGKPIAW